MTDKFTVSLCISGSDVTEISIGNAQHRGARDYQEDSFGYTPLNKAEHNGFAAIVADGMGGLSAGDKVSAYAVSAVLRMSDQINTSAPVHVHFKQLISTINREVVLGGSGGGCTFAAVYCRSDGVYWCSLGDSRIYLYRNGRLFQLTEDGDHQNQLLDEVLSGKISFEYMMGNEKKTRLFSISEARTSRCPM